jgi:hypothetical protein
MGWALERNDDIRNEFKVLIWNTRKLEDIIKVCLGEAGLENVDRIRVIQWLAVVNTLQQPFEFHKKTKHLDQLFQCQPLEEVCARGIRHLVSWLHVLRTNFIIHVCKSLPLAAKYNGKLHYRSGVFCTYILYIYIYIYMRVHVYIYINCLQKSFANMVYHNLPCT